MAIKAITVDKETQGGVPCFTGTRTPVGHLFEYLAGGQTVSYFLEQFPRVTREQVDEVLAEAERLLIGKFAASNTPAEPAAIA